MIKSSITFVSRSQRLESIAKNLKKKLWYTSFSLGSVIDRCKDNINFVEISSTKIKYHSKSHIYRRKTSQNFRRVLYWKLFQLFHILNCNKNHIFFWMLIDSFYIYTNINVPRYWSVLLNTFWWDYWNVLIWGEGGLSNPRCISVHQLFSRSPTESV